MAAAREHRDGRGEHEGTADDKRDVRVLWDAGNGEGEQDDADQSGEAGREKAVHRYSGRSTICAGQYLISADSEMGSETRNALVAEVALEIRAFQTAVDTFDDAVADRLGINRTDLRCLDLLDRHEAMTAGELANASGLTTGAVTRLLDRVERMGYAQRVRDTADRRRVLVQLTPLARERAAELYGPIAHAGQAGLERYSADQLKLLRDFLRGARALHDERTNRLRAQPQD
jgi:DNA-binding MarR family transcriptional regulator